MKNRWLIALSAVGIHISIGSVYAWSVLNKPLIDMFGWDLGQTTLTFTIAILLLGFSAAFLGKFVEKIGPRKSGMIASILFGIGLAGSGLAVRSGSLWMLYLFYGVIGGMGLGTGYITPVSTLIKWFPDKRGLATGMAIMGFGFASFISSFAMKNLMDSVGLEAMFYCLGAGYFIVMFVSSLYLEKPPAEFEVKNAAKKEDKPKKKMISMGNLTVNEALKTSRFYILWFMLFINITCGIALISVAKDMAVAIAGMTALQATTMVGLMGIFNGLGRIGWSSLSDIIGRPSLWVTFFIIQIAAFFLIPALAANALIFQMLVFLIITCYGGGFASVPAYISDIFGTKQVSAIHGCILTAWALAGVAGPRLTSYLYETTESFNLTLYIFGGLFVVALVLSGILIAQIKKMTRNIPAEKPLPVTEVTEAERESA